MSKPSIEVPDISPKSMVKLHKLNNKLMSIQYDIYFIVLRLNYLL